MRARRFRIASSAAVVITSTLALASTSLAITITSFNPKSGLAQDEPYCPGGQVTITGTGFVNDGSVPTVTFSGGVKAVVQVGSDTTLYVTVPGGAQTGPITVTTPAGSASTVSLPGGSTVTPIGEISLPNNLFTVLQCWGRTPNNPASGSAATAPAGAAKATVSAFAPTKATAGATVMIRGENFTGATAVKFAGVKAAFKVVSATKITATVPAGAKSGKISVTTPAGTSASSKAFIRL